MGSTNFGGTTKTSGFTDNWVRTTGISMTVGRTAANGNGPILISKLYAWCAGNGAPRSVVLSLGSAKTSSFTISSSGNGNVSTGGRSVTNGLVSNGGTRTFTIDANGSFYFARDSSGGSATTDSYGFNYGDVLAGRYDYAEVPSAPLSPAVTGGPAQAIVTWAVPSSNGGSAVTGYKVEYATNVGFTTGLGSVLVGNVLTATIKGLLPATTYWFRVSAINAVADAAFTTSVPSTSVSALIGVWAASGVCSFRFTVTDAGTTPPNYASVTLAHTIPLTGLSAPYSANVIPGNLYSASISIYLLTDTFARRYPLVINPFFDWKDGGGTTLSTVALTQFNLASGVTTFSFSNMTMPVGAASGNFRIEFPALNRSNAPNFLTGDVVYADAAMLVNGAAVAYFDNAGAGPASYTPPSQFAFYDAFKDNNTGYSVNVAESYSSFVQTSNYPLTLLQPTPTDSNPIPIGTYSVTSSDGLHVPAATWLAAGGGITAEIDPTPGVIKLTFTGPIFPISGFAAPYTFSVIDIGGTQTGALSVLGTGVLSSPETINLLTGADPAKTNVQIATTFDSPFMVDIGTVYDSGSWIAAAAAGPNLEINFSVATSSLQGFGLTQGAIINYKNANWRIVDAVVGAMRTTIKAQIYTTIGQMDAAWSGQTLDDFDALWSGAGYEAGDINVQPLRMN